MGIRDLLWACPVCGRDRGIGEGGKCVCGVAFSRGAGARIEARHPDGQIEAREAADWADRLPDVAGLLQAGEGEVIRVARVRIRSVTGSELVRTRRGRYLNHIETFGAERLGTIELDRDAVTIRTEGPPDVWPFQALTAVQASSSTLQLKARDRPLVSLRFLDDSIFLWENLLTEALRFFYRRTGRGEIVEFQPRIATR
jgi:hypothetical protein